MNRVLKIILIILAIIVLLAVAGGLFLSTTEKNLESLTDISIENIDLSTVSDGTYKGSYKAFPVSAEVAVTVQDGKITSVDLIEHNNGQGEAAEAIPEMVVQAQSLQVDVISGATYSSKVILLAIEDALKSPAGK